MCCLDGVWCDQDLIVLVGKIELEVVRWECRSDWFLGLLLIKLLGFGGLRGCGLLIW